MHPPPPPRSVARQSAATAALLLLAQLAAACGGGRARALVVEPVAARSTPRGVTVLADDGVFARVLVAEGSPLVVTDLRAHGDRRVLRPDLMSGDPVAQAVSTDHPFHRGLRVGHGLVNGADLWSDPDRCRVSDSSLDMLPDGRAVIVARVQWTGPGDALLCTESRRMTFASFEGLRLVDLELRLVATGDGVVFGDTKDGLVALRLADDLAPAVTPEARAFDAEGRTGGAIWGQAARWVAHARGADDTGPDAATVAFLDHPGNLRSPTHWHARPYGIVAANPFGLSTFRGTPDSLGAFRLEPYGTLDLRYRIVVANRVLDPAEIDALWAEFAGEETPVVEDRTP